MPVVYNRRERAGRVEETFGPGDLILLGKYRFFKYDAFRRSVQFSAFGGLELPTGSTDQKDGGNRLPPAMQPGLGAVNGIFGLAIRRVLPDGAERVSLAAVKIVERPMVRHGRIVRLSLIEVLGELWIPDIELASFQSVGNRVHFVAGVGPERVERDFDFTRLGKMRR